MGGLIFPFLISSALLDKYGFATMCRAWAGITLAVYAIAVYLIKPRVPLRKPRGPRSPWFVMSDFRFLKNPVVIVMVGSPSPRGPSVLRPSHLAVLLTNTNTLSA